MTNKNNAPDITEWLNKDQGVTPGTEGGKYTPPPQATPNRATGNINFRTAKLGGMMLVSIYFPILYLLTGLNSIRDWFVFLVLLAVTAGVCSLKPFRPAFERSIRYFTALMVTAVSIAVALVVYKVLF